MKNRTVIGIICIIFAFILTFAVSPLINSITANSNLISVVRVSENITKGSEITSNNTETVKVNKNSVPEGVIKNMSEATGKYASADLFSGDYLINAKLSDEGNTADDVFSLLDGSKVAVSFTIDTFAAGLSGKLYNGDIISIMVIDKTNGEANIPAELKYVKVITTTTAGGIDKDFVVKNDDGSFELPSTVTVLCNSRQAKLIAKYEASNTMQAALVYHGDNETAKQFLDKQDAYFGGVTE
ncbi:MAG: Flp pilus assembly protein CpaB [Acutalibacteraceae bacterium]